VPTPQEVVEFFGRFLAMKAEGQGNIFISHKLDEMPEIADRITAI